MQIFIDFLIEIQNKILKTKTVKKSNKIGFGVSIAFTSKKEKTRQKLEQDVSKILKQCKNNPEELIKFVEAKGTKVYKIPFAKKIMNSISQEIGFVPEAVGIKALLINFAISANTEGKPHISFKSEPMFVLDKQECDSFWFVGQFYKWYAMKLGLTGYEAKTQELFNSFMHNPSDAKIQSLTVDEILDLKEAIARDVESINFVIDLAKSTVDSKVASSKITLDGALV